MRLDRSVPRELETIVLKALRKEPADRYGTAQEMADDLAAFPRRPADPGSPADACRAAAGLVPAASVDRRVRLSCALILLSAASLVSTASSAASRRKTLAEQRKAEAAYRRERRRAEEAEARFRLARRAVDELIRASEEELAHRPGMEGLRKRLLGIGARLLPGVHRAAAERPGCAGRAARHHATGRDDSRRPGGAPRRGRALPARPADGARRPAARQRPEGEGGRSFRPRRQAVDGSRSATRARLPPPAERVRIALEQARANEAEVDAILTPSQRVRLRQIALQSRGTGRLPRAGGRRGTRAHARAARADPGDRGGDPLRPDARDAIGEDPRGRPARRRWSSIVAVLTAEQARRWKEMAGEPIRGTLSTFPTPFRPQRDPKRAAG